jgi:hypothetical protein
MEIIQKCLEHVEHCPAEGEHLLCRNLFHLAQKILLAFGVSTVQPVGVSTVQPFSLTSCTNDMDTSHIFRSAWKTKFRQAESNELDAEFSKISCREDRQQTKGVKSQQTSSGCSAAGQWVLGSREVGAWQHPTCRSSVGALFFLRSSKLDVLLQPRSHPFWTASVLSCKAFSKSICVLLTAPPSPPTTEPPMQFRDAMSSTEVNG